MRSILTSFVTGILLILLSLIFGWSNVLIWIGVSLIVLAFILFVSRIFIRIRRSSANRSVTPKKIKALKSHEVESSQVVESKKKELEEWLTLEKEEKAKSAKNVISKSIKNLKRIDFRPKLSGAFRQSTPQSKVAQSSKNERFTDYDFFDQEGNKVPHDGILRANRSYSLSTFITGKPSGIPTLSHQRVPISEPSNKRTNQIYVTLHSDDFKIFKNIGSVELPTEGDSSVVDFDLEPTEKSRNKDDLKTITVRWYYEFNLIEEDTIYVEVGDSIDGTQSNFNLDKPIHLVTERREIRFEDIESTIPSAIHIDIKKKGGEYFFYFLIRNPKDQEIEFPVPISKSASELDVLLSDVRTVLHQTCVTSSFSKSISSEGDGEKILKDLAREGRNMWKSFFKSQTGSSIYEVGKWLESHPPQKDAVIQVSIAPNTLEMLFPWTLFYDKEVEENDEIDIDGFWGFKFLIQHNYFNRMFRKIESSPDIETGFFLWDKFNNVDEHIDFFESLKKKNERIKEVKTILDKKNGLEYLKDSDPQIIYFYAHGHTKYNNEEGLRSFISYLESVGGTLGDSEHSYEKDKSWIQLKYGKIFLVEDLYEIEKLESRPLVFLNMCESAKIYPSLSENFINYFLDRGATCVIGTECPMTATFAAPFAQTFFENIIEAKSIGQALLETRRHYIMKHKNPLGLAYSSYGNMHHKLLN